MAGPEMVLSTPFWVSTTPGIFLMASSTLRAELVEQCCVVGEELDLDGFGRVGEVADHVLQDLGELDVERGLGLQDLGADSAMTSSMERSRLVLRRTVKSP